MATHIAGPNIGIRHPAARLSCTALQKAAEVHRIADDGQKGQLGSPAIGVPHSFPVGDGPTAARGPIAESAPICLSC